MTGQDNLKVGKRTCWAAFLFYVLICFEFFYMITPIALYFYAVYEPFIVLMEYLPGGAWIMNFFLPHIVLETSSSLVNLHNYLGLGLFLLGLVGFLVGAIQIYYAKLRRRREVTGLLYSYIRHPQYLALAVAGLGLLLLWPRYITLIMYVTMLFVYYLLAKSEEADCLAKYGESYEKYLRTTGMFLPIKPAWPSLWEPRSASGLKRAVCITLIYCLVMTASLMLAWGLRSVSVNSLYSYVTDKEFYLSITKMEPDEIQRISNVILADIEVADRLASTKQDTNARLINYLAPRDWFASEVPMNQEGAESGSHFGGGFDLNNIKLIFTRAGFGRQIAPRGLDILYQVTARTPLLEVWFNRKEDKITRIVGPSASKTHEGIPMPVF